MQQLDRHFTYVLDTASGTTFIAGVINGQTILMVLGGLASLAAIINHADQFLKRNKKTQHEQDTKK